MAATATTLTTVELLEKILLCLPILEILKAQRVGRLWRDCVKDSLLLQRRLFRAAVSATDAPRIRKYSRYNVQPVAVNPLLHNIFRIRHSDISGSYIIVVPPKNKRTLQQASISENILKKVPHTGGLDDISDRPLILDEPKFYKLSSTRSRHHPYLYEIGDGTLPALFGSERRALTSERHVYRLDDWASMLATQPPIKSLNLRCDSSGGLHGGVKVIAADDVGVTLRDIVKSAAEFYRKRVLHHGPGFGFFPELTIYQPLDIEPPKNADRSFVYSTEGRRVRANEDDKVGFQRAWKTKLRCNLG